MLEIKDSSSGDFTSPYGGYPFLCSGGEHAVFSKEPVGVRDCFHVTRRYLNRPLVKECVQQI